MPSSPPQSAPRKRKRWLRWLLWACVPLVLAAVALPWWLPAVVVRIAAMQGVQIGAWTSHGWNGAEYREIRFVRDTVSVDVASLQVPVFAVRPRGAGETPVVRASDVVVVIGSSAPQPDQAPPTMSGILRTVGEVWTTLQTWLPPTRIERASIEVGGLRYDLGELVWRGNRLEGSARFPWKELDAAIAIEPGEPGAWHVTAQAPAQDADVDIELGVAPDGGVVVAGTASWLGTVLDLEAGFGSESMVPASASIAAGEISVPAATLGLEGYGPVTGSMLLHWERAAYTVSVIAQAAPIEGSDWPALGVDVRASGDFEHIRIDAMDVNVPAVRAALSRPLELKFAGIALREPVEFSVDVDLGAVSALEAQGTVSGLARVQPGEDGSARVEFELAGRELTWRTLEGVNLELAGHWAKPEIVLVSAVLDAGPEARLELSGSVDTESRLVRAADVKAVVTQAMLQAINPDLPPIEKIELAAGLEGPWAALNHKGKLVFSGYEWSSERLMGGDLAWTGEGTAAAVEGVLALPGGGSLPFALRAAREASGALSATIERLLWSDDQGEWWSLQDPAEVHHDPVSGEWRLDPWRIAGVGFEVSGEAKVRWPAVGDVSLLVTGLDGGRFGGVLPEAVRGGRIENLHLRALWDHGPVAIEGGVRATYSPIDDTAYAIEGEFVTQEGGLAFGSLEVLAESGAVLRGVGRLPLVLAGTDDGFVVDLSREKEISLDLASEPNPVFWTSIADLTGWTIEDPKLSCRLHGSIDAPRGGVEFSAATLKPPPIKLAGGGQLPELTGLLVKLAADDSGLSITESMVAIDYRWVTLTGKAPWTAWTKWRESGIIDWRSANFDLATNPMPIEIASRVFPTELAPVGEVSIKIAHDPDEALSGRIWLHGAASRPIGPIGSIREIQTELEFFKYRMVLTQLEGLLGGQTVQITGEADISNLERPSFSLHVVSSRVPLVRRSGLIVRAEMDLKLVQGPEGPAAVTGGLYFGPSLYDADLLSLLPTGGVETPESRPPYFSVEEQPFADWTLDVAVHGEGFMRITTPFYRDLLSTDLKLGGTLAEPRIVGWVWGSGGSVIFPFGRIAAEQVLVTLSRENPYEPTLVVSGAGRVLGYDVRMEASGSASDPRLIFTSDPPLSSQQVFLMLTTGAVPSEDAFSGATSRASRLAFFLGRNLAASLGLGNDSDERLSVQSGENVTRQGGETVYVQYDLNGRWSIVGEYDRFDAYNGGVKFRLIDR